MSRREIPGENDPAGFPRVSGDEPLPIPDAVVEEGFSPRERG